jgi:two-component system, chemotaxis family, chemotaxis protein CheY
MINSDPEHKAAQKQAMVVDDDDTVSEHVTKMLRTRGFNVVQEFDGMAALQRCRTEKFDLVMCDIRMPRLNGVSFLRNLRQAETNLGGNVKPTTVVMMSSLADNATKREVSAAGTPHLLLKPIGATTLDDVLALLNLRN